MTICFTVEMEIVKKKKKKQQPRNRIHMADINSSIVFFICIILLKQKNACGLYIKGNGFFLQKQIS
jgi:hypothetical protein